MNISRIPEQRVQNWGRSGGISSSRLEQQLAGAPARFEETMCLRGPGQGEGVGHGDGDLAGRKQLEHLHGGRPHSSRPVLAVVAAGVTDYGPVARVERAGPDGSVASG